MRYCYHNNQEYVEVVMMWKQDEHNVILINKNMNLGYCSSTRYVVWVLSNTPLFVYDTIVQWEWEWKHGMN